MNLTPNQEKTLNKIVKTLETCSFAKRTGKVFLGMKFKNSWNSTWYKESDFDFRATNALEKKGLITLVQDYDRETGVFNPQAKSWGYSSMTISYYAILN
jgi:hypothetical protein